MTKPTMTNKCTSSAGRLDGHGSALEQYRRIAQCGMYRATLEATGRRHWATTCSVLPQHPPGQQANKQKTTNTPTKLIVFMVTAMRRYNTTRIAQWRRPRASLEATGCHHLASTRSNSHQLDMPTPGFPMFFIIKLLEKATKPQG